MPEGDEAAVSQYEVVIHPDDGLDKDHAELLRKRLIDDGFHDHVVELREVEQ